MDHIRDSTCSFFQLPHTRPVVTTPSIQTRDARIEYQAGEMWLEASLAEHASIASFARFVQELLWHSAPPELVTSALQAAAEEVEHAQTSFAIASRLLGKSLGPGPLPLVSPRNTSLAELALSTFEEACIEESFGALLAATAAEYCTDDDIRSALLKIAEEEARHAELAWRTVSWALQAQGDSVRDAIDAHIARRHGLRFPNETDDLEVQLLSLGVVTGRTLHQVEKRSWHEIVLPLWAELRATIPLQHADAPASNTTFPKTPPRTPAHR